MGQHSNKRELVFRVGLLLGVVLLCAAVPVNAQRSHHSLATLVAKHPAANAELRGRHLLEEKATIKHVHPELSSTAREIHNMVHTASTSRRADSLAASNDSPTACLYFGNLPIDSFNAFVLSDFLELKEDSYDNASFNNSITCDRLNAYLVASLPADVQPPSGHWTCFFTYDEAIACAEYGSETGTLALVETMYADGPAAAKKFQQGLIEVMWPVLGACETFFNIIVARSVEDLLDSGGSVLLDDYVLFNCAVPSTRFPFCSCYRGVNKYPDSAQPFYDQRFTYDPTDGLAYAPFETDLYYYTAAYDASTNAHCFIVYDNNDFGAGRPLDPTPGTCGGKEGYQHWTVLRKMEINLNYSMKRYIKGATNGVGKPLSASWAKDTVTGKWADAFKITTAKTSGLSVDSFSRVCLLVDKKVTLAEVSASSGGLFWSFFDPTAKCCSRTYTYLLTDYGSKQLAAVAP